MIEEDSDGFEKGDTFDKILEQINTQDSLFFIIKFDHFEHLLINFYRKKPQVRLLVLVKKSNRK